MLKNLSKGNFKIKQDLDKKSNGSQKKGVIREWVESIIFAVILVILLKTFFFQMYKIPTTSMVPTLKPGDKIFVSKLNYGAKLPFTDWRLPGFGKPARGDVVVFVPPQEVNQPWYRRKPFIKRLIAKEGDHVLIDNGDIYINEEKVTLTEVSDNYYYNQGKYVSKDKELIVPEDKYFLLGDNSKSSLDSRFWGFADKEQIIGKAIFIWWPPKRIGVIK
jgi:signal peptidase I